MHSAMLLPVVKAPCHEQTQFNGECQHGVGKWLNILSQFLTHALANVSNIASVKKKARGETSQGSTMDLKILTKMMINQEKEKGGDAIGA